MVKTFMPFRSTPRVGKRVGFFERRRRRRIAGDLERILLMLEKSPQLRELLRQALRVKGTGA